MKLDLQKNPFETKTKLLRYKNTVRDENMSCYIFMKSRTTTISYQLFLY